MYLNIHIIHTLHIYTKKINKWFGVINFFPITSYLMIIKHLHKLHITLLF